MSFARAEGLQAHGHVREACTLGARLARELLARPPALGAAPSCAQGGIEGRRARRRHTPTPRLCAASHRLSCLASATLAKCAFLCTVSIDFNATLQYFRILCGYYAYVFRSLNSYYRLGHLFSTVCFVNSAIKIFRSSGLLFYMFIWFLNI